MIVGIGTDIVSVPRMEAALQRRGEAPARRLLSDEEYEEFQGSVQPARFPVSRFAAFDAARKALGAGLTGGRLLQSWRLFRSLHHRALR